MSLLKPGTGNPRERLNAVEIELDKIKGVLNLVMTHFELERKFFAEVTSTMRGENSKTIDITDRKDTNLPDGPDSSDNRKSEECPDQDEPEACQPPESK